ncbi:MAG: GNAT family N-acetyltransferase [Candidatus Marsarchaeota archaeon]|nr:GNAT family N-acetyltransferase [Candidatus Marsarchaeota archaeon]
MANKFNKKRIKIHIGLLPNIYLANLKLADAKNLRNDLNQINKELNCNIYYTSYAVKSFIKNSLNFYSNEFHFGVYKFSSKQIIGMFSIVSIDYRKKICEIGYWITKKYRKKGYGKDALALLIYFIFKVLKFNKIYAVLDSDNIYSLNLLLRNNFKKTINNNKYIPQNKILYKIANPNKIKAYVLLKKDFLFNDKIKIE